MSIVNDILFIMAGSNDENDKNKAIVNTAKTLAYGAISFATGYGVAGFLAGRTFVKVGVLLALGTNPMTAALAALAGAIAYRVFKSIIERSGIEGAGSYTAALMMGGYVIYRILPTNLTETLVIGTAAYLANRIFFFLFAMRMNEKKDRWAPSRFQALVNAIQNTYIIKKIGLGKKEKDEKDEKDEEDDYPKVQSNCVQLKSNKENDESYRRLLIGDTSLDLLNDK